MDKYVNMWKSSQPSRSSTRPSTCSAIALEIQSKTVIPPPSNVDSVVELESTILPPPSNVDSVVELESFPADPKERRSISSCDPNIQDEARRYYIQKGPCQPTGHDFPQTLFTNKMRKFKKEWFKGPYSQWLEYSIKADAAFCLCCYLFKNELESRGNAGDAFTKDGFRGWNKALERFRDHVGDVNSIHDRCFNRMLDLMDQRQSIQTCFDKQSEKEKNDHWLRLNASVKVVRFLLRNGCSFRGHDESEDSENKGLFLELLEFHGVSNPDVKKVILGNAPKNDMMICPTVQKEIVDACAKETIKAIVKDLDGDYFGILVDESKDVSHKEQMALILRYVNKSGEVIERFLGLVNVSSTTAQSLKNAIYSLLVDHSLSPSKIRGQGYDGASNMQGEKNGLKTLIFQDSPSAHCVHCFAHQLQLTLVALSKKHPDVYNFFYIVTNVLNIIGSSFKRRDLLRKYQAEKLEEMLQHGEVLTGKGLNQERGLQRAGDTRWGSHFKTLESLMDLFPSVVNTLSDMKRECPNPVDRFAAENLLDYQKRGGGSAGSFPLVARKSSTSTPFSFRQFYLKLLVHFLMLLLFCSNSLSSNDYDVEGHALIELLKALNDSNNRITDWNIHLVSPCFSWSHVTCRNGNVISLSLASNGFSGTLSPSITKLKFLVSLDLQDNNLSGVLPVYLSSMSNLQNLNLANNRFNGSIPAAWGQLNNLKHLVMRGNHVTGTVPNSLLNITGLKELDLSSNDLTGGIPLQLFSIPTYNFSVTHLDCGNGFQQPCVPSSSFPVSVRRSKLEVAVTGASCGAFLLLLVGVVVTYKCNHRHKLKHDQFFDVEGEVERNISLGQLRRFSWREIQIATDNFSEGNIIGQGGFGKVYKGYLMDNTKVAVKRLTDYHNPGGEAAFLREVQLISVAVHRNLLRLIGFCTTSSERILVYPFMQNLSVAYRLRDLKPGEKGLDWPTRRRIAFGAAHGLEYLHEHCDPKIIHRDLKAANILLDDNFEPVLGDFGLAKLVDTKLTHITTQVRGTMGHIAPEYLSTGKSSEKTDVFGYGITLLELVTGQRAIDFSRLEEEEDVLLLDHIKKLLREKRLGDIVDGNMKTYDPKEVETILQVALLCTQSSPEDRPKMAEVITMLKGVGLAERWAEWEQLEEVRNQQFSLMSRQFMWAEDSTHDQEAIQLSQAR